MIAIHDQMLTLSAMYSAREKKARIGVSVLILLAVISVLISTFLDQDLFFSLFSVSALFTFKYAFDHPELMLASSWREFCEVADRLDGKSQLLGSRLYFATAFCCALYIIVF